MKSKVNKKYMHAYMRAAADGAEYRYPIYCSFRTGWDTSAFGYAAISSDNKLLRAEGNALTGKPGLIYGYNLDDAVKVKVRRYLFGIYSIALKFRINEKTYIVNFVASQWVIGGGFDKQKENLEAIAAELDRLQYSIKNNR